MTVNVRETPEAAVEVVEELSEDEVIDRHRLELKVERAFVEAGKALSELRERRLYRSTHRSFEQYCQDRFGFSRQSANFKIAASEVVENLTTFSCQNSSAQVDQKLTTFSCQVLPTRETQVRPLAKLAPNEQRQVWLQAVERAGGVPTESIVKAEVLRHKGIVESLKEKVAAVKFVKGEMVEIKAGKDSPLRQFDGMWGSIEHVGSFSYTVRISIAKDVQQCKGEEMAKVDDEYTADITTVAERIRFVVQNFELEPIEYDILGNLQRSKWFTPKQLRHLEIIERDYGILQDRVGA